MEHDSYLYIKDCLHRVFRKNGKEHFFFLFKKAGNKQHNPVQVKQSQQVVILTTQPQDYIISPIFSDTQQ